MACVCQLSAGSGEFREGSPEIIVMFTITPRDEFRDHIKEQENGEDHEILNKIQNDLSSTLLCDPGETTNRTPLGEWL